MLGSKLVFLTVLMAIGVVNAQHTRKPENWKIDFVNSHGASISESGYGGRDCIAVASGEFPVDWTKYNGPAPGNVKNTCCIQQYSDAACSHRVDNICTLHAPLQKTSLYYKIVNC
ncbi:hypothetical protein BGW37DRAFT_483873 [Umbelopsis sp. PMI_123]|nr:hypothetical protein BGW37DRAFT_483873 [Umbelopsis sp. PMI_123]